MSIFGVFSANIPFASNNRPFLRVKIQNYLDKINRGDNLLGLWI